MLIGIHIKVPELGAETLLKNREIENNKSCINEIQIIQYFTTKPQRSRLLGNSNCFEFTTTLDKPVLA